MRDSLIDPSLLGPLRPRNLVWHIIIQIFTPNAFEKLIIVRMLQGLEPLAEKIDVNAGPNMNISFGASGAYNDRNNPFVF